MQRRICRLGPRRIRVASVQCVGKTMLRALCSPIANDKKSSGFGDWIDFSGNFASRMQQHLTHGSDGALCEPRGRAASDRAGTAGWQQLAFTGATFACCCPSNKQHDPAGSATAMLVTTVRSRERKRFIAHPYAIRCGKVRLTRRIGTRLFAQADNRRSFVNGTFKSQIPSERLQFIVDRFRDHYNARTVAMKNPVPPKHDRGPFDPTWHSGCASNSRIWTGAEAVCP
jgi:hypothetical protein